MASVPSMSTSIKAISSISSSDSVEESSRITMIPESSTEVIKSLVRAEKIFRIVARACSSLAWRVSTRKTARLAVEEIWSFLARLKASTS